MTKKTVPTAHALVNVPVTAKRTGPTLATAKAGTAKATNLPDHSQGGLPSGQPPSRTTPPWMTK